ncbi:MAG: FAD-binding oxidoreductase [Pseudotabrizicola sp.]|uniref:FAD-binding oxidoreductase n=1 Tax=Pseudotabrizicola sp. TaxID=2939647 RepID=UPI002715BFF4|nr:FAD-binding oxidoreductase [Pseudotabrizicola sp.]MDO9639455.1 FAD-binding oxidoreductase [Pseudotabrizicola sp.]
MTLISDLSDLLGPAHVLTGSDMDRHAQDWTGTYPGQPVAVVRPFDTAQVAGCVQLAARHGVPVVPVSGNTGLVGGTYTTGGLMISLERMNRIRDLNHGTRTAVVEAGVILSALHDAAAEQGLYFPLWFGARGSAMIGGVLSTNAGGSNVLRYGSTRSLCLGLEVVLADGRVLNLMSALHKDNSGYALRDLFIGAEGTLGIITAAVMKLVPAPRAHATATLALRALPDATVLLNRLQEASGGLVEAFEFMPASYSRRLAQVRPDLGLPFADVPEVTILTELGATAPALCEVQADGSVPLTDLLETTVAGLMEEGLILDAIVAQSEAQRRVMWARREAAAEITFAKRPFVDTDIAVPLDRAADFLTAIHARLEGVDQAHEPVCVAHLGDGNLHFTAFPVDGSKATYDRVITMIEDVVADLGGSFSAEHGVGLSKLPSMARRKDSVALDVMRAVKAALDPTGLMNPGKVVPAKRPPES